MAEIKTRPNYKVMKDFSLWTFAHDDWRFDELMYQNVLEILPNERRKIERKLGRQLNFYQVYIRCGIEYGIQFYVEDIFGYSSILFFESNKAKVEAERQREKDVISSWMKKLAKSLGFVETTDVEIITI